MSVASGADASWMARELVAAARPPARTDGARSVSQTAARGFGTAGAHPKAAIPGPRPCGAG
jgi:hypothetical protein